MRKLTLVIAIIVSLLLTLNVAAASDYRISQNDKATFERALTYMARGQYDQARVEARKASDGDILNAVLWLQYQENADGNRYEDITRFIDNHPGWPKLKTLRNRAERSLTGDIPPATLVSYFKDEAPVTGYAMRLLAEAQLALGKNKDDANKLLRQGWIQGDFSTEDEQSYLAEHGRILRGEDHIKRMQRLIMEGQLASAKRLYPKIPNSYQRVYWGALALTENKPGIDNALGSIPESLRNDPALVYARLKWHMERKNFDRMIDYAKSIQTTMPAQDKWWAIKHRLIREILEEKRYKDAYHLAKFSGNEPGSSDYADSEWLAGWLALRFLGDQRNAYKHFYNMYQKVSYPVSRSRGAYWAARAAEKNDNADIAREWYKKAADHSTTFYGQLAYNKLYGDKPIVLPPFPSVPSASAKTHKKNSMLKMAYLFGAVGRKGTAESFIDAAVESAKTPEEMAVLSQFGEETGEQELSIVAAKKALQQGVVLSKTGWPVLKAMPKTDIEKSLALGIIRQESRFDPEARSPADAAGLMQLIPDTAKRMSKALDLRYDNRRLTADPLYNVKLGSYYLGRLVEQFDGSYILAIASYNAGPANVRRWIDTYGDPRRLTSVDKVIDWIELIPYSETRNYVQRVLENTQVYRGQLQEASLMLKDDLMRSYTKVSDAGM